jgi:hypothetical protein
MFEGYYRVRLDGTHVGYAVQRFDFDPKKSEFTCSQFLRVKIGDDLIQESTRARANDRFEPLSYQYIFQRGGNVKKVEATIKDHVMKLATAENGGSVTHESKRLPDKAILSSFLLYSILQNKLKARAGWKFNAVAEELGASYPGTVKVVAEKRYGGKSLFKIEVGFKQETLDWDLLAIEDRRRPGNYLKGEVVTTRSVEKGFRLDLVPRAALATANQVVPSQTLLTVFGNVPTGKINVVATPPSIEL